MIDQHYLQDSIVQMRKLKDLADKAVAQVSEPNLFATLDAESNSIALLMKHLSGNMRSRWTDFLTSDGEKPDRHRDREFEQDAADTREAILQRWEAGWALLFQTLTSLTPEHLARTVRLRGEAHTVLEAINRQMTHYAQHVGQILLLAKHYAGPNWKTLSIPKRKSAEFEVSKSGEPYRH